MNSSLSIPDHAWRGALRLAALCAALAGGTANAGTAEAQATADAHYWGGVGLMGQGRFAEAAAEFERALLDNPDHAGAWFDYGLSLCRLRDLDSCRSVLAAAIERFGLPPTLRAAEFNRGWLTNGQLRAAMGYSSNLTRGSSSGEILLRLDGNDIPLPLSPEQRPQAAAFLEFGAEMRLHSLTSGLALGLSAYRRDANGAIAPTLEGVTLNVGWNLGRSDSVGVVAYEIGERNRWNTTSIGALGAWWESIPEVAGDWQTGLMLEQRRVTPLDERYLVGRIAASRMMGKQGGPLGGIRLRLGAEAESTGDRPGAAQMRFTASLAKSLSMGPGVLELGARGELARDHDVYSPLLGDARRSILLLEGSARLAWPIEKNLTLIGEVRGLRQHSNIALFSYRETVGSLGIRYAW